MCSTAAVQVCLDVGEGDDVARRWEAVHALGPVLLAAFANSPVLHGRQTGWKSSRMACWLTLDPRRTAPPPVLGGDPAAAWARRVLDSDLLCVRRGADWTAPTGVTFAHWVGRTGDGAGLLGLGRAGAELREAALRLDHALEQRVPLGGVVPRVLRDHA